MRGQPDAGSIHSRCEVVPTEGGFVGILSIPYDGRRETLMYPCKRDAEEALKRLAESRAPGVFYPRTITDGFTDQQRKDFDEALAAIAP